MDIVIDIGPNIMKILLVTGPFIGLLAVIIVWIKLLK